MGCSNSQGRVSWNLTFFSSGHSFTCIIRSSAATRRHKHYSIHFKWTNVLVGVILLAWGLSLATIDLILCILCVRHTPYHWAYSKSPMLSFWHLNACSWAKWLQCAQCQSMCAAHILTYSPAHPPADFSLLVLQRISAPVSSPLFWYIPISIFFYGYPEKLESVGICIHFWPYLLLHAAHSQLCPKLSSDCTLCLSHPHPSYSPCLLLTFMLRTASHKHS